MGRLDESSQDPSLSSQKAQRPGAGWPTALRLAGRTGELPPAGGRANSPPCDLPVRLTPLFPKPYFKIFSLT